VKSEKIFSSQVPENEPPADGAPSFGGSGTRSPADRRPN